MAADQQFCLRWNNHQSTLVSVFDSLLEKGALVDCTIAAEGQSMKAHKVVLSACSSYFETLLSEHYEKHPIIILKDVKYQELRALMDYMYRGEVNILQDQLASLLKVAESLQIKGLSDSGGGDEKETAQERPDSKKQSAPRPQPISRTKSDTENRRPSSGYSDPNEFPVASPPATPKASRNECSSPIARKRKKVPENSMNDLDTSSGLDGYDNSSSNELPPQKHPVPKTPVKLPLPKIKPPVPVQPVIEKSVPSIFTPVESPRPKPTPPPPPSVPVEQDVKPKVEPTSEVYIQPKTEFVEEEEEIEDLTLDDEEDYDMSDQAMAGPSHGGDGSNQGFLQWQDQSQDEMFNAAQEAIGGQKDSQDTSLSRYIPDDFKYSVDYGDFTGDKHFSPFSADITSCKEEVALTVKEERYSPDPIPSTSYSIEDDNKPMPLVYGQYTIQACDDENVVNISNCGISRYDNLEEGHLLENKLTRKGKPKKRGIKGETRTTRYERKKLRNAGKEYKTMSGKIKAARETQPLQHCRNRCQLIVSDEARKTLFEQYWKINSFNGRLAYVAGLLEFESKKRSRIRIQTDQRAPREINVKYHVEHEGRRLRVCKSCFLKIFGESKKFLETVIRKKRTSESGAVLQDGRGRNMKGYGTADELLYVRVTRHSMTRNERESYLCSNCGKMYSQKNSLMSHVKHECGKEPKFKCTQCDYKSYRISDLKLHVKVQHPKIFCELF